MRAHRAILRLLAVALGAVAAVGTVEGVLWVANRALAPKARGEAAVLDPTWRPAEGERVILCLGDSNTYGIHLPEEDSYPARLAQLLAGAPGGPYRVLNLGYPGRNSAEVRYQLAEQLELYRPMACVVWVGTNTSWSVAMGHLWNLTDREEPPPPPGLLERSRAVRMLRVLLDRPPKDRVGAGGALVEDPGGRLDFEERGAPRAAWMGAPSDQELARRVSLDLSRVAELCAERGVRLVLLDYPYPVRHLVEVVNPAIRAASTGRGARLLSLEQHLSPRLDALGREGLTFADFHLRAPANREVARLLAAEFVAAGWLEGGTWLDVPELEDLLARVDVSVARASADGEWPSRVELKVEGTPLGGLRLRLEPLWLREGAEYAEAVPEPLRSRWLDPLRDQLDRPLGFVPRDGVLRRELPLPAPLPAGPPHQPRGTRFFGWHLTLILELADGQRARSRGTFVDPAGRVLAGPTRAARAAVFLEGPMDPGER